MDHNPEMLAWLLGGGEVAICVLVGVVLIYGKRLPEIGRSVGRSVVEFKKGLSGADDEKVASTSPSPKAEQEARKSS